MVAMAKGSLYLSVLIDGATDVSSTEKELIYLKMLNDDFDVQTRLIGSKSVHHANATGIMNTMLSACDDLDIALTSKLVGFCSDGASVNMGRKSGIAQLLKADCPWLVVMHCLNHRLELAAKDAFKGTSIDAVLTMLNTLHQLYDSSPKRWRDLQAVAEIMTEQVVRPKKANGTRWVQHKHRAVQALLQSYGPIVVHLDNNSSDENKAVPAADRCKFKNYKSQLTSLKFVLNLLLLNELLAPLSALSLCLQQQSVDVLTAVNKLDA